MVVVVASYYRLGLINIALRYTRFLNTLKYICMQRGVLCRAFFRLLFFLSSFLSLSFLRSLSLCASVAAPDLSVLFLEIALSSDSHVQLANHFLLRNPASTRSALGFLALFCSSASALLVLFCFFRFVQSSSPARESLAATRLPLEAATENRTKYIFFLRYPALRATRVSH